MVQVVWKPQHLQEGNGLQHTYQNVTIRLTQASPECLFWVKEPKCCEIAAHQYSTHMLSRRGNGTIWLQDAQVLNASLLHWNVTHVCICRPGRSSSPVPVKLTRTRAETPGRPCRPVRRHPKGHTLTSRGKLPQGLLCCSLSCSSSALEALRQFCTLWPAMKSTDVFV